MKLIINTVNLQIGGAFQRAVSFLNELKEIGKDLYYILENKSILNRFRKTLNFTFLITLQLQLNTDPES